MTSLLITKKNVQFLIKITNIIKIGINLWLFAYFLMQTIVQIAINRAISKYIKISSILFVSRRLSIDDDWNAQASCWEDEEERRGKNREWRKRKIWRPFANKVRESETNFAILLKQLLIKVKLNVTSLARSLYGSVQCHSVSRNNKEKLTSS